MSVIHMHRGSRIQILRRVCVCGGELERSVSSVHWSTEATRGISLLWTQCSKTTRPAGSLRGNNLESRSNLYLG